MCTFDFSGYTYDPISQTDGPTFNASFDTDCISSAATNFLFAVNGQVMGGSLGYFHWNPGNPSDYTGWLSLGNDEAAFAGPVSGTIDGIWSDSNIGSLTLQHQEIFPYFTQISGGQISQLVSTSVPAPCDFLAVMLWCVVAAAALAFSTRDNV